VDRYPAAADIPQRNVDRLQAMGIDAVQILLKEIAQDR
jgi:hypothetical protein